MSLTKTWFAGLLLGGAAVWATGDNLWAQVVWQEDARANSGNGATGETDWQQRVLKRSSSLQWQGPERPASSRPQADSPYQAASPYQQPAGPYQTARRLAYGRSSFVAESMPQEPPVAGRSQAVMGGGEIVDSGVTQFEPMAADGVFAGPGGCASCGGFSDECGVCDQRGQPASDAGCEFGYEIFNGHCGGWLRNLAVAGGVQGFKGPLDRGVNGNFGFNEGLGFGGPVGDPWGCGYQIGANFVQSDFANDHTVTAADQTTFRVPRRNQSFVTAAIFRRAECGGFQWGVAYDYLHDNYFEQFDLQQIRSETGYVIDDRYEIGYYGAYGVGGAQPRVIDGRLDPTDMFVVYLRRNFENGGDGRIWGGVSGNGDGLLGADLWVPLGRSFALQNRINYLIPKSQDNNSSAERESWGLTIQLVWYPGHMALCQHKNPYRPMFNVADNSLFMVDRLTGR